MSDEEIVELKANMMQGRTKAAISPKDMLSSGSTLLNLACSGRPNGAFAKGKYYFFVGDSGAGKTFLALTCLAEAASNRRFDEYELIHDNAEDGALMDMSYFFGEKAASRIRAPRQVSGSPRCSSTVEEFYFHLDMALKSGKPFIYILDSMDCLTSEDDLEKFDEVNKHRLKKEKAEAAGKELKSEVAGSYGTGKAKANSNYLRVAISEMQKTGSILIIIAQTRDKIGNMPSFNTKTRSGGHALKFYATLEMWLSVKEEIKKRVKGKDRAVGALSQIHIKKNRETGRNRKVLVPVYYDVGIDDIGSCVDYLVEEGHWKDNSGINAPEFEFKGKRDELIRHIEQNDGEKELRRIVADVWEEIEKACHVERKRRYD